MPPLAVGRVTNGGRTCANTGAFLHGRAAANGSSRLQWIRLRRNVDSTSWMAFGPSGVTGGQRRPLRHSGRCRPRQLVRTCNGAERQIVDRQLEQEPLAVAGHVVVAQIRHAGRDDAHRKERLSGRPGRPARSRPPSVAMTPRCRTAPGRRRAIADRCRRPPTSAIAVPYRRGCGRRPPDVRSRTRCRRATGRRTTAAPASRRTGRSAAAAASIRRRSSSRRRRRCRDCRCGRGSCRPSGLQSVGYFAFAAAQQQRALTGAVGQALVEVVQAAAIRSKHETLAVGRPHRRGIGRRVVGDAQRRSARQIEHANVGAMRLPDRLRRAPADRRRARAGSPRTVPAAGPPASAARRDRARPSRRWPRCSRRPAARCRRRRTLRRSCSSRRPTTRRATARPRSSPPPVELRREQRIVQHEQQVIGRDECRAERRASHAPAAATDRDRRQTGCGLADAVPWTK